MPSLSCGKEFLSKSFTNATAKGDLCEYAKDQSADEAADHGINTGD
ncbi:hypothetical protein Z949_312 [Sulfitobacter guttiformis KCTC 32187]|nr:hypothetical protein Z949_312 [Sulfitobacter guttiformis KCTC 32187]